MVVVCPFPIALQENNGSAIYLDLDIKFRGRSNIVLEAGSKGIVLQVRLKNLEVVGTMRIVFAPLTADKLPCFKAVAISFTRKPQLSYNLGAMKLPLSSIPGRREIYCLQ